MINLETALAADDLPLVPLGAYAVAARVGAASCALATDGAGRWWYRNFAPTERAAWDAAAERCEGYRRYLLGRTTAPTESEAKLLARYQQAEQAAWDAYRSALRATPARAA